MGKAMHYWGTAGLAGCSEKTLDGGRSFDFSSFQTVGSLWPWWVWSNTRGWGLDRDRGVGSMDAGSHSDRSPNVDAGTSTG